MPKRQRWRFGAVLLTIGGALIMTGCSGYRGILTNYPDPPNQEDRAYQPPEEQHARSGGPPPWASAPEHRGGPPPWAPAHGRQGREYRYYASAQVYFDTQREVYFYYQDGQWRVSATLPGQIRVTLDDSVTLEMGTEEPYRYHPEVVEHYPPGHSKKRGKAKGKHKRSW